MSKRFTDGNFALGLVIGILVTILFFLIVSEPHAGNKTENVREQQSAYSTNADEAQNEPQWWYWSRRLVATEDTLAQWIMAFFTIGAVLLVWRTLIATQEMVVEAKKTTNAALKTVEVTDEIGRKQIRPYLSYSRCEIFDDPPDGRGCEIGVRLIFKNYGQTPAISVSFDIVEDASFVFGDRLENGFFAPPTFPEFREERIKGRTAYHCGPGEECRSHVIAFPKGEMIALRNARKFYYIAGTVRYKDGYWRSNADYKYCRFCFLMDRKGSLADFASKPASEATINIREHGPDNYAT